MRTIALWSPLPSGSGTTALAASLPLILALEFKLNTLVLHGGASGERVEEAYPLHTQSLDHSLAAFQDQGMNAVERLASSGRLMPENLGDYTASLIPNRLDLLGGRRQVMSDSERNTSKLMTQVIKTAVRGYDVIVADAGNGKPNMEDREILNAADLILVGLNQNLRSLERVFENELMREIIQDKASGIIIGRYDQTSHCTLQNIKRRFGLNGILESIPYCSQLTDAWNMRTVQVCVQRGRGGMDRKRESPLYHALRCTALAAAEQLGLPSSGYTERGA